MGLNSALANQSNPGVYHYHVPPHAPGLPLWCSCIPWRVHWTHNWIICQASASSWPWRDLHWQSYVSPSLPGTSRLVFNRRLLFFLMSRAVSSVKFISFIFLYVFFMENHPYNKNTSSLQIERILHDLCWHPLGGLLDKIEWQIIYKAKTFGIHPKHCVMSIILSMLNEFHFLP